MRRSFGTGLQRNASSRRLDTGSGRVGIAALLVALTAALAPSSALADGDLVASPTTVKDSASIAVRWTPRVAADKDLFSYALTATSSNMKGCANSSSQPIAPTWTPGEPLRFTVRPSAGGRSWCPRGAGVLIRVASVSRTPGGGDATLATAFVAVVDDPATPANPPGVFQMAGGGRLTVTPAANIGLSSAVTVSWRTTVKLGRDEGYQVVFQAGRSPQAVAPTCITSLPRIVGRGSARGRRIRVRLNPYVRQGISGWCPSEYGATIVIQRVKLNAKGEADPKLQDRIRTVGGASGLTFKR